MGYEDAAATRMLATNCACCRRPLVDAKSLQAGMGPSCRKKHGFDIAVSPEARSAANKIVYQIALENSKPMPSAKMILDHALALKELGFEKLAEIILDRTAQVKISEEGDMLVVQTPYNADAVPSLARLRGRPYDRERKANLVPATSRRELWQVLCCFFAGMSGVGPKGAFVLVSQT